MTHPPTPPTAGIHPEGDAPPDPRAGLPPLLTLGDFRLAQPSAPVPPAEIPTPEFQARLGVLLLALEVYGANGVAAPQLGWFQRYFVMRDPGGSGAILTWINPVATPTTSEQVWYWEGCLSVPGYKAFVGRAAAIAVTGLDAQGQPLNRTFRGWESHLFQHEFDHLDGILFPYRVADPRHMVRTEELDRRSHWPKDWPATGAGSAPIRAFRSKA
ncbi:MAG: peptide deformylase [Deltaproteobacteria bacterium]|nr:peptide deformylase [Deltaproteobacteria bacterium]